MAQEPPRHRDGLVRRLARALDSPLRVRFHVLIATGLFLAVLAIWIEGRGVEVAARDLASREFQARTAAAASNLSARLGAVSASIGPADDLLAHGHDLKSLCDILGREPRRPYQRLYAYTPDGALSCYTASGLRDQPEVIARQPYFLAALSTGQDQVGGPLVDASSGRVSVISAHPVRNGGGTAGVLVAAADASSLFDPAWAAVGAERTLVFGREAGWFDFGSLEATSPPFDVGGVAARASSTREPCPVVVVGSAAWTCSPVGGTGLVVAAAHPTSAVFAAVEDAVGRTRYRVTVVLVLAASIALASDFLFLRRIRLVYGGAGLAGLGAGDTAKRDEIDAFAEWARETGAAVRRLEAEVDGHERRRLNSERDLLTSIAETVEIRYPFLRDHGDRVGRYARQIGIRLGLSDHDLDLLEFAARVHDLGKISIADAVYLKPGRLEPIEIAQMQLHASRGGEIASRMGNVPREVAQAIRHHHERWDGAGYPDGLSGTDIPLWSRMIAVADSYDAMTEARPYRERPLEHDEALKVLRDGAGSQWDATAVQAFLEVVDSGNVLPKPVSLASRRAASEA